MRKHLFIPTRFIWFILRRRGSRCVCWELGFSGGFATRGYFQQWVCGAVPSASLTKKHVTYWCRELTCVKMVRTTMALKESQFVTSSQLLLSVKISRADNRSIACMMCIPTLNRSICSVQKLCQNVCPGIRSIKTMVVWNIDIWLVDDLFKLLTFLTVKVCAELVEHPSGPQVQDKHPFCSCMLFPFA